MASPADPIPVATYGKDPKIAEAVAEKLLPDIEGTFIYLHFNVLSAPFSPSLLIPTVEFPLPQP